MPTYLSLYPELKNTPVRQQPLVEAPYEYNYLLPVIAPASTVYSIQNASIAPGSSIGIVFVLNTNYVVNVTYSAGTARIHGALNVELKKSFVAIEIFDFLLNESDGNILLFKTESFNEIRVNNNSGVTLGLSAFVGVGTQITPPNHPYV